MKNNLAMVLALVALALSIWAAWSRPGQVEHKAPAPERGLTPLPRVDDNTTADCGAPGSITTLKALMRAQVNPTMSKLSFALYHDQTAQRFAVLAESAKRLLGCIHLAPTLPPQEIGLAGLPDYFRFLGNMQENALGVEIAAMEQDVDGARHWFGHLKQDCVACHSRFRVETENAP
jgi:hypothetical protein